MEGIIPASVFVEVYKLNASNERTYIGSDTITLNTSRVGIYSLAASPVAISAVDEHVEISVYTDSSCFQLISQMDVMHALLEF